MCAQRRTVVKRNVTGGADVEASQTATAQKPQKQRQTAAQTSQRPPKPAAAPRAKGVVETKQHPLSSRLDGAKKLYRETRAEMTKITWPDRETTRNLTIVVIGISFVLGIFLGGLDYVLFKILEWVS
jgi:preprotein translocase subunit SecE